MRNIYVVAFFLLIIGVLGSLPGVRTLLVEKYDALTGEYSTTYSGLSIYTSSDWVVDNSAEVSPDIAVFRRVGFSDGETGYVSIIKKNVNVENACMNQGRATVINNVNVIFCELEYLPDENPIRYIAYLNDYPVFLLVGSYAAAEEFLSVATFSSLREFNS